MKIRIVAFMAAIILSACNEHKSAGNPLYGQLENTREYGVVVSINQSTSAGVSNAGTTVSNVASASVGSMIAGTAMNPFQGLFGTSTNNNASPQVDDINTLHYVIKKDSGETVHVDQDPEPGETIVYPGQRASIQTNGGFMRVYPADVEDRFRQQ